MKMYLYLFLIMLSGQTLGQETWNITLRPALNFPTERVVNEPLRIGNGIDFTVDYTIGKNYKLFAGVLWNRFDTDQDFFEENITFTQRGVFLGGLFFFKPFSNPINQFYFRAGLTSLDAKIESNTTNFIASGSIGYVLGFGVNVLTIENWSLLPELRYSTISNNSNQNFQNNQLTLSSISLSVGLQYSF